MDGGYWRFRSILKQAAPFLLLSSIGELGAGLVLKNYLDFIEFVPGIFVLLPALMDLRGAIQSALASRLGSAYHLGFIKQKSWFGNNAIRQNFFAAIALALIASVASAFFAFFVCELFGLRHISLLSFVLISVIAGFLGALILGVVTVLLTVYSIRKRLDPDNVTIPSLTTIGDIVMVFLVFAVMVSLSQVVA